ncbi:MAG: transglutaminase domain-containing protein [Candidatus Hydrogenedentes bacterium]|nr:transglutaminase domain-containing protein [Candidatus Hydrogenedentota bacterium]
MIAASPQLVPETRRGRRFYGRSLAVSLVLIEAAAYAFFAGKWPLGAAASLLAVASLVVGFNVPLSRKQTIAVLSALGVAASLPHVAGIYARVPQPLIVWPWVAPLLLAAADSALALQLCLLFYRPKNAQTLAHPKWFVLLGTLVMTGLGTASASPAYHARYGAIALAFVSAALVLGFPLASSREAKARVAVPRMLRGVFLVVAACFAWTGASLISAYGNELDALLVRGLGENYPLQTLGFSRNASLNSVTRIRSQADEVVLRVFSESVPGYLRGCVYDTYSNGRWSSTAAERSAEVETVASAGVRLRPDHRLFRITPGKGGEPASMQVWQTAAVPDTVFAPLGTSLIAARADGLVVNNYEAVRPERLDVGQPVTLWFAPESLSQLRTDDSGALLQVPDNLAEGVRRAAQGLFQGKAATLEKIAAVQSYFRANYRYELGIAIPAGADPLNFFLLERPPAHCEYFAAGALMLLRLAGVPCRYVTGFVTLERNPLNDAWIARNKDAHAWVEAYDAGQGWVIVEATPPAGVPCAEEHSRWHYALEYAGQRWRELRAAFAGLSVRSLLALVKRVPAPVLCAFIAAMMVVCSVVFVQRRRRRNKRIVRSVPPQVRALHRLLKQQDRVLRRAGLTRDPTETLHHFASRIEREQPELAMHASWYRYYAGVRYAAEVNTGDLDVLRSIVIPGK